MKYLLSCLILILFLPAKVHAQKIPFTVTCKPHAQCEVKNNQPLFTETNIIPGQVFQNEIQVFNQSKEENCLVTVATATEQTSLLNDYLLVETPFSTYSLSELSTKRQALGVVKNRSRVVFPIKVIFDPSTPNEAQGVATTFDWQFVFSCQEVGSFLAENSDSFINDKDKIEPSVLGVNSDCNQAEPNIPTNVAIQQLNETAVVVSWAEVELATGYKVQFENLQTGARFTHTAVGNSHQVRGLSLIDSQYAFEVSAQNECALGQASELVFSNQPQQAPEQLTPQVLGSSIELPAEEDKQQLEKTVTKVSSQPWLLIIIIVLLTGISALVWKRNNIKKKH